MPQRPSPTSHRDSWPPTLMRIRPGPGDVQEISNDPSLKNIDTDPLTYFLTPTPSLHDDAAYTFDMGLDAGIEDDNKPKEIVRSVSPSQLNGLKSPLSRALPDLVSPGLDDSSDGSSPMDMDDEDNEEYIRFSSEGVLPIAPTNLDQPIAPDTLLSPSRPKVRPTRPSTTLHARGRAPQRHQRLAARSHVWREPSPDVWSIEEEGEEAGDEIDIVGGEVKHVDVHVPASKPKKVVRFVLPGEE